MDLSHNLGIEFGIINCFSSLENFIDLIDLNYLKMTSISIMSI